MALSVFAEMRLWRGHRRSQQDHQAPGRLSSLVCLRSPHEETGAQGEGGGCSGPGGEWSGDLGSHPTCVAWGTFPVPQFVLSVKPG